MDHHVATVLGKGSVSKRGVPKPELTKLALTITLTLTLTLTLTANPNHKPNP